MAGIPVAGAHARYWNAGHIIGSASIEVEVQDGNGKPVRLMFSGDIGPDEKVFYNEPEGPSGFDYILSESTYGGREREDYTLVQRREALKQEINAAMGRGGNLVIPAFAVERSQELLHDIGYLIKAGEIDPKLVFLDSPLASKVTGVYRKYAKMFDDVELGADELFNDPRFRIIEAVEDSKAINAANGPAVIIAAAGMAESGRILHHFAHGIGDHRNLVLFVGFQAEHTLGRRIQEGTSPARILGDEYPVRAEVETISGYSAHADRGELLAWVRGLGGPIRRAFVVHGEPPALEAMAKSLREAGIRDVRIPRHGETFDL